MKRIVALAAIVGFTAATALGQVQFFQGDFKRLQEAAKQQGKPYYVDVYTDWCGPCKLMTARTFGNNEVGQYSNSNFLAYKLNAEEGEGIALAQRWQVEGYPTVIFFSPDGKITGRILGYYDADRFLDVLRKQQGKGRLGDAGMKPMQRATTQEKAALGVLFRQ